jgi:hypothetical protein
MAQLLARMRTPADLPGTAARGPGILAVVSVGVPASLVEPACFMNWPNHAISLFVNQFYSTQANPAVARGASRQGLGGGAPWEPRPLHFYL